MFQAIKKIVETPGDMTEVVLIYGSKTIDDIILKAQLDAMVTKSEGQCFGSERLVRDTIYLVQNQVYTVAVHTCVRWRLPWQSADMLCTMHVPPQAGSILSTVLERCRVSAGL